MRRLVVAPAYYICTRCVRDCLHRLMIVRLHRAVVKLTSPPLPSAWVLQFACATLYTEPPSSHRLVWTATLCNPSIIPNSTSITAMDPINYIHETNRTDSMLIWNQDALVYGLLCNQHQLPIIHTGMPCPGELNHALRLCLLFLHCVTSVVQYQLLRHPAVVLQVEMHSQLTCTAITRSSS